MKKKKASKKIKLRKVKCPRKECGNIWVTKSQKKWVTCSNPDCRRKFVAEKNTLEVIEI